MALGVFADTNLAKTATLSGGAWSGALPLGNLLAEAYIQKPARCATPANLASSQFQVDLPWPSVVNLVGVIFHTLSISARYRLTVASLSDGYVTPQLVTDWLPVIPSLYDSAALTWESPNWWTGQLLSEELDLYPRHLWIPVPAGPIASSFKLEIDDHANAAGYFDLGGLWVVDGWSPEFNFERGRVLKAEARSQVDEGPSGRLFSEERRSRRSLSVEWRGLYETEAQRLFDAGIRAGVTKPVLFLPDLDNASSLFREAFPATFEAPPSPTFSFEGLHQAAATFKEIIA